MAAAPPTEPDDADLRAADGRVPGRRGRATRTRLLECTRDMLRTTSYRDLKVVDIAREAGTSPATFYQYFPDVEAAVLVLAEEMAQQHFRFANIVRETKWKGRNGYDGACALADEFFAFWEENQPVLRVVDLATEEGDGRFRTIRTWLLNDLTNALTEVVAQLKAEGRHPDEVDPSAVAAVLVSMLAHVAAHRYGLEFWGIRTNDVRTAMARILYWSITAQKPPS
jgi:AcrR family transcriptional regulator